MQLLVEYRREALKYPAFTGRERVNDAGFTALVKRAARVLGRSARGFDREGVSAVAPDREVVSFEGDPALPRRSSVPGWWAWVVLERACVDDQVRWTDRMIFDDVAEKTGARSQRRG